MTKDPGDQDQHPARTFLPATLPEKEPGSTESSRSMLRQWMILAIGLALLVTVLWAILGDGFSQGGKPSRSKSPAKANPYRPMPSNPIASSGAPGHKIIMEGHWLGMEVGPLTARLARSFAIPSNIRGVLVDEVTLLSAEQGMLAGDIVVDIGGQNTANLNQFLEASKKVKSSREVVIGVFRKGKYLSVPIKSEYELGFAQMEAAPMIRPTDTAPHRYYGPCTSCHTIGNTGQLPNDLGDTIQRPLSAVRSNTPAPHRNYGKCVKCHKLLDRIFAGHSRIGAPGGP